MQLHFQLDDIFRYRWNSTTISINRIQSFIFLSNCKVNKAEGKETKTIPEKKYVEEIVRLLITKAVGWQKTRFPKF